jgi:hypothetical protein
MISCAPPNATDIDGEPRGHDMHAIAIHGGAGTLSSAQLTPETDRL